MYLCCFIFMHICILWSGKVEHEEGREVVMVLNEKSVMGNGNGDGNEKSVQT